MNSLQKIASQVMTPPAFSNKVALAAWAISAIVITRTASIALADLGALIDRQLANRDRHGSFTFPSEASDTRKLFIRFADRTSKRVQNYFPKLVYAALGVMGLSAAKSNDVARMAALGVVAFGYFSSRNDMLAIARGKLAVTIFGEVKM